MESRERILSACERRRTDRPPLSLRCTPEAWDALAACLGVRTSTEVLDKLDIDLRWVAVPFIGPAERSTITLHGEGTDFWGCKMKAAYNEFNTYYEFDGHRWRTAHGSRRRRLRLAQPRLVGLWRYRRCHRGAVADGPPGDPVLLRRRI